MPDQAELPRLVDSHSHVMDRAFASDRDAVLERARASGVVGQVCVGYDLETSRAAVALAARSPEVVATVGIHPNNAGASGNSEFDQVEQLARTRGVAGIGETGLDYYRDRTPPIRQQESLAWHLALAEALHLPVVIHARGDVEADLAPTLEASAGRRSGAEPPGVLHCFSSPDTRYLERMLAAGYYVSFAGSLTFRGASDQREMAGRVPIDRLLVETDCPYLTPEPCRGRRNEPAFVQYTADCLATVKGLPLAELATHLSVNAERVFPRLAPILSETAA